MKNKILVYLIMGLTFIVSSCGFTNATAITNFENEVTAAKYTSEYAKTVNKLEMKEGNC